MPRLYLTSLVSRERNRIHARKTRQRKKEQMQNLQCRAEELKQEQLRLKQIINEKDTASILAGLFTQSAGVDGSKEDPCVRSILVRSTEEIPDASKVPELPALILPGHHASKRVRVLSSEEVNSELPSDGIDYDLLGRDRSKCSSEELDRIRRERNRMHAKRTRDRKRLFTEQMSEICRQLEEENHMLQVHLSKIDPEYVYTQAVTTSMDEDETGSPQGSLASCDDQPTMTIEDCPDTSLSIPIEECSTTSLQSNAVHSGTRSQNDQFSTLLKAAHVFEMPFDGMACRPQGLASDGDMKGSSISDLLASVAQNLIALSDDSSAGGESQDESFRPSKRQRLSGSAILSQLTTTVGW